MVLHIQGMKCPHCQKRVENALNNLADGTATVDLERGIATVTTDVSAEQLCKAVEDLGFTVTSTQV